MLQLCSGSGLLSGKTFGRLWYNMSRGRKEPRRPALKKSPKQVHCEQNIRAEEPPRWWCNSSSVFPPVAASAGCSQRRLVSPSLIFQPVCKVLQTWLLSFSQPSLRSELVVLLCLLLLSISYPETFRFKPWSLFLSYYRLFLHHQGSLSKAYETINLTFK